MDTLKLSSTVIWSIMKKKFDRKFLDSAIHGLSAK